MAEEGKYLTSFLEIYVNTERPLNNLALLTPNDQGTYFHEYFHFLQDVTTCSGLAKIWSGFDRFRQQVASVQAQEVLEVNLPLTNHAALEQRDIINFLEIIRGSGQIAGLSIEQADDYSVQEIFYEEDERITVHFPHSLGRKAVLRLVSEGMPDKRFLFGDSSVAETMAYMVESKFYPTLNKLPKYP